MSTDAPAAALTSEARAVAFIDRWTRSSGAERSNYQMFLSELCDLLDVARPDPSTGVVTQDVYVFDKPVPFKHPDGTSTTGFADLYKRGHFVCETKQGVDKQREEADALTPPAKRRAGHGVRGTKGWDDAMLAARGQAEGYVRAIDGDNPPFVLVVDVGHAIDLYADFSRLGKIYSPFPDAQSHRVKVEQLVDPKVRDRLRLLWTEPLALDPSRHSAKVTREIAAKLAILTKSLEKGGHHPEQVAQFLMRCLFTFFVEDIGLLCKDKKRFTHRLKELVDEPDNFPHEMRGIWQAMNAGDYAPALKEKLRHFNGGLFEHADALPLNSSQIRALHEAADRDWTEVEPAIFGTLLERALDADERHALGAHYTPRAYVERLVIPTIIEPLTDDWNDTKAAAVTLAKAGKEAEAIAEVKRFLEQLCETKVLDPACGTGNFLYVAMARMKDLEGEVRLFLRQLGEQQDTLEGFGHTVDPHQFLGIELNPRAAAIAELVLWIGYLQWQVRTGGVSRVKQPVLRAYHNIENRDAVLAYDERQLVLDEQGEPVTRWDGRSVKPSLITGEDVPDETKRVEVYRYTNPRKAEWPKADYVVGNPPFIGNKRMRELLGDEYVGPLRIKNPDVPGSADFVMFWWSHAAEMLLLGTTSRAGLITTNSITQSFNRQVLQKLIDDGGSISFAIADHPWVDSTDGADVRVAMAVGQEGAKAGRLLEIDDERPGVSGEYTLEIRETLGLINADLSVGVNSSTTAGLRANTGTCLQGVIPLGQGFVISADDGVRLGRDTRVGLAARIKRYRNGKDLSQRSREAYVIDLEGLTEADVRSMFPEVYQHVLETVKPERDQNREKYRRENWWKFGRKHTDLRDGLKDLSRYIVTVKTAKHRVFMFLEGDVVPDSKLYAIALDDPYALAVLSSRAHVTWATRVGGWLGVGNDPTYNNRDCFDRFAFPAATNAQKARIRDLGEQLDAHRKRQQAAHPGLTITDMYNVLEKLRAIEFQEAYANAVAAGKPGPTPTGVRPASGEDRPWDGKTIDAPPDPSRWTDKEKRVHEQGLVSVLKQIHDELDAAVFDAYGWPADLSDEQILERLVALNHERAAEEARGVIRWLRPEFQNRNGPAAEQATIDVPDADDDDDAKLAKAKAKAAKPANAAAAKLDWPKTLAEQARAVRAALAAGSGATPAAMAKSAFKGAKVDRVEEILDTLVTLGQARRDGAGTYRA